MISSVRGTAVHVDADAVVVEVGGVGLHVAVTPQVARVTHIGDAVTLHTTLIVREDALSLFGFSSDEQRSLFELLLSVQGVGPRLALAVLSSLSLDVLRQAVGSEQPEVLDRVPGVGRKTAEKIVFALKDKLGSEFAMPALGSAANLDTEVMAALTALGYSVVEAQAAVQNIPKGQGEDVEDKIRLALQYFTS